MTDSNDIFKEQTAKRNGIHEHYKAVFLMFAANILMFLSLVFNFRWWERVPALAMILGAAYLIAVLIYDHLAVSSGDSITNDVFERLKDWRDYFTSDVFHYSVNTVHKVRLKDGDYFCIRQDGKTEYLRLCTHVVYRDRYELVPRRVIIELSLKDILDEKDIYKVSDDSGVFFSDAVYSLQRQLEGDGYSIIGVYNKFGDKKWNKSDNAEDPKKYREYVYGFCIRIWLVILLIVYIAPLFPIAKYINQVMQNQ